MISTAQQIAVFGGAFDPFHNGHVAAIKLLLSQPDISKVLVVPSGDRPDKHGVSRAAERYEMTYRGVQSAFGDDPRIEVSDIQSRGAVGFSTIDLVTYARQHYGMKVAVIIGRELLGDLPQWHRAEELRQQARFLVLERPGAKPGCVLSGWQVEFLPPFGESGFAISSTELRRRLASGDGCDGLMPPVVRDYCISRGLYQR
jgi:nicotinate-nucleotide adenylyltransferase